LHGIGVQAELGAAPRAHQPRAIIAAQQTDAVNAEN
jgi:hypothetical protein